MRKHQCETRPFLQRVNVAFARANLNERIWLFQLSHQKHKWLQMYKLLTSNYVLLLTYLCLCSTFNYFWLFRRESAWDAVKVLLIIKNNRQTGVWSKYLLSMLSSVFKPGSVTYWKTYGRLLVIALTGCLDDFILFFWKNRSLNFFFFFHVVTVFLKRFEFERIY